MTIEGTPVLKIGTCVQADPEYKMSKSGKPFAKFRLSVRPNKDTDPTYYDVLAFNSLGEHVSQSVFKGDRVIVAGTGTIDVKEGKEYRTIFADEIGLALRFTNALASSEEVAAATAAAQAPFEDAF